MFSNIGGNRLRGWHLSGNNAVVASNYLLDFGYCKSSSIRVMSLSNNSWSMSNWCTNNSTSIGITDSSNNANISFGHGSTIGTSHESTSDHKSVHVFMLLSLGLS